MTDANLTPQASDAILGSGSDLVTQSAILGGLEGLKQLLQNPDLDVRKNALLKATNYGDAGIKLLLEALADKSGEIQRIIRPLLWHSGSPQAISPLRSNKWRSFYTQLKHECDYSGYRKGNNLNNQLPEPHLLWLESSDIDPSSEIKLLETLSQTPAAKDIQALTCELVDTNSPNRDWMRQNGSRAVVKALANAHHAFPNLTALLIGTSQNYSRHRYINRSKVCLTNCYSLLQAYPDLEILQLRGWLQSNVPLFKPELEVLKIQRQNQAISPETRTVKHRTLKTLILEVNQLEQTHLAQICSLQCDSLEYLEITLRGKLEAQATLSSLAPVLSKKSFPNLTCLRLLCSKNSDAIAEAIAQSPLIERLRVLDLSLGNLSDRGASALLQCPAVAHLHTLDVTETRLSPEMRTKLSQLPCHVSSEDDDRYYSSIE
jgi:hypothetical protein